MAEAVTIPSPSVFLRDSPPPAEPQNITSGGDLAKSTTRDKDSTPPPPPPAKAARKQSSGTAAKKAPARKQSTAAAAAAPSAEGVAKPKQSKSRNGMDTLFASFKYARADRHIFELIVVVVVVLLLSAIRWRARLYADC